MDWMDGWMDGCIWALKSVYTQTHHVSMTPNKVGQHENQNKYAIHTHYAGFMLGWAVEQEEK